MPNSTCTPNMRFAYDYFIRKGLRDFQAAGIVGNLMQESNVNPLAAGVESNGTISRGIAQWGTRWQNLLTYAQQLWRDPLSLELQLDFLWRELESAPATLGLNEVRAATTLEDAVLAFQGGPGHGFERCGNCQTEKRIAYAKRALLGCPIAPTPYEIEALTPPRTFLTETLTPPRATPVSPAVVFTVSALVLAGAAGFAIRRLRAKREAFV